MIKYHPAPEIQRKVQEITEKTGAKRDLSRILCVRSTGSQARHTLARCHALPRIMQIALDKKAHYVIEVISEKFDKLNEEDQIKILIHEIMHIPKGMKGGFRQHDYVCKKNVEQMYKLFRNN